MKAPGIWCQGSLRDRLNEEPIPIDVHAAIILSRAMNPNVLPSPQDHPQKMLQGAPQLQNALLLSLPARSKRDLDDRFYAALQFLSRDSSLQRCATIK
jgi:hypothetical protein